MPCSPHILIVEDEPMVADVLQATLESTYRVNSVGTVQEALAFMQTSHVDVALVDSILPDGRGTDVISFAARVGTAVISMSGYPADMAGVRSDQRHLSKPFGAGVLLITVKETLHEQGS